MPSAIQDYTIGNQALSSALKCSFKWKSITFIICHLITRVSAVLICITIWKFYAFVIRFWMWQSLL